MAAWPLTFYLLTSAVPSPPEATLLLPVASSALPLCTVAWLSAPNSAWGGEPSPYWLGLRYKYAKAQYINHVAKPYLWTNSFINLCVQYIHAVSQCGYIFEPAVWWERESGTKSIPLVSSEAAAWHYFKYAICILCMQLWLQSHAREFMAAVCICNLSSSYSGPLTLLRPFHRQICWGTNSPKGARASFISEVWCVRSRDFSLPVCHVSVLKWTWVADLPLCGTPCHEWQLKRQSPI